jgi:hypothetical protein
MSTVDDGAGGPSICPVPRRMSATPHAAAATKITATTTDAVDRTIRSRRGRLGGKPGMRVESGWIELAH